MKINSLVTSAAVLFTLTACTDPAEQDSGGTAQVVVEGRAVDGPLAFANVFVDLNENGQLESFEPRAITDRNGYFGTNGLDASNPEFVSYCALPETDVRSQHCLELPNVGEAEALIRIVGGFDTLSGTSFEGELTRRVDFADLAKGVQVSPLSAIIANDVAGSLAAALLGDESFDPDANFIGDENGEERNLAVVAAAIQADRIVTLLEEEVATTPISESSNDSIEESAEDADELNRFHEIVREALAENVDEFDGLEGDNPLDDENVITTALADAVCAARQLIAGGDCDASTVATQRATQFSTRFGHVANVRELLANLEEGNQSVKTTAKTAAKTTEKSDVDDSALAYFYQASEVILRKALAGRPAAEIDQAVTKLNSSDVANAIQLLEDLDVDALIDNDFSGDANAIADAAEIKSDAVQFDEATLATTRLIQAGGAETENGVTEETQFAMIFDVGENQADGSGTVKVCGHFKETGNTDPDDNEDETLLLNGNFELVSNNAMVLSLEILGTRQTAVFKSIRDSGDENPMFTDGNVYRFNFGGELSEVIGPDAEAYAGDEPVASVETEDTSICTCEDIFENGGCF